MKKNILVKVFPTYKNPEKTHIEVAAYCFGGLAIHKPVWEDSDYKWSLTHISSGTKLYLPKLARRATKKSLIALIHNLANLDCVNWNLTDPDFLLGNERSEVGNRVMEIINIHFPLAR